MIDDEEFVPGGSIPAPEEPSHEVKANDVEGGGVSLAHELRENGFQPVILFGNAASGKTSLLLSLFALIRTEYDLEAGLDRAERLLPHGSQYGDYLHAQSQEFLGRKLQAFIDGSQPPKSNIEYPFFVPITLSPKGKPEQRFAFLESNGEWYRPDFKADELYPRLRRQVEDFISHYQGPLIFLHLVPYTQEKTRAADYDASADGKQLHEAQLAIVGALQAYKALRVDRQNDSHLMLVSKWDARSREHGNAIQALENDRRALLEFVATKYGQAYTSYQALGLSADRFNLEPYCSGVMTEAGVLPLRRDNLLRDYANAYPKNLWNWLYRTALAGRGEEPISPFPEKKREGGIFAGFLALLDRIFR